MNQGVFVAIFFISIFVCFSDNIELSTIDLPIKFAVPFYTTTILGWYTLWLFEFNIGIAYGVSVVAGTSYFVCCCIYISAICDHYTLIIQSRIKYIGTLSTTKNKASVLQKKMKTLLSQAVEIHVKGFE